MAAAGRVSWGAGALAPTAASTGSTMGLGATGLGLAGIGAGAIGGPGFEGSSRLKSRSNLGTDSGSNATVSLGGAAFISLTLLEDAAAVAVLTVVTDSVRVERATSCAAPAKIAAGVLSSGATPEVGESEMSSSSVKSMPLA